MRTGQAVARLLQSKGLISDVAAVEDAVERMTKPDFIPGGGYSNKYKNLRPAEPGMRCCCQTANDIQSGPIFCGDPADWMADADDANGPNSDRDRATAVCDHHLYVLKGLLEV